MVAGVTLRENNLKELEGGLIMRSQGALVANRRALKDRQGLLEVVHELIERFEAHLKAGKFYSVLANMRGDSAAEVHSQHTLYNAVLVALSGRRSSLPSAAMHVHACSQQSSHVHVVRISHNQFHCRVLRQPVVFALLLLIAINLTCHPSDNL